MCGLVSVISKRSYGFNVKDIGLFEELLLVDVVRGDDATGIITVDKDGDFYITKEATPSFEFLPTYRKLPVAKLAQQTGVALIGHNRKGTLGGWGDAAAHPFAVKERFAMVHNGTLYGHRELAQTDVDSEALAIVIEETINKENYQKADLEATLGRVVGAYAVIWYNQQTHQVQFVRNSERSLCIGETDENWILASEGAMIQWICMRNGMKLKSIDVVKEAVLHTLDLGEKDVPLLKEELSIKKAIPPTVVTSHRTVGAMVGVGTNKGSLDSMSKNEFKRVRRALFKKEIEFYVEDYVEATPPHKYDDDYQIIGKCDDIGDENHIIHGKINVDRHGIYAIEYADSFYFSGTVVEMQYNAKTKQAEIFVESIKTLPMSLSPTSKGKSNENTTTVH